MRTPNRGDILQVNLNPTQGQELKGARPVLVVSPKMFNKAGLIWVCPITQGGNYARFGGFTATLQGTGIETQGVVLCNQIRTLDCNARKARFIESVPDYVMDDVLARLQAVLE